MKYHYKNATLARRIHGIGNITQNTSSYTDFSTV